MLFFANSRSQQLRRRVLTLHGTGLRPINEFYVFDRFFGDIIQSNILYVVAIMAPSAQDGLEVIRLGILPGESIKKAKNKKNSLIFHGFLFNETESKSTLRPPPVFSLPNLK
jgi:hypothetical protein